MFNSMKLMVEDSSDGISLRSLGDANFGTLGSSKNKHLVAYDASQNKFVMRSMDDVLSSDVVLDGDLPDDFVTQIEARD